MAGYGRLPGGAFRRTDDEWISVSFSTKQIIRLMDEVTGKMRNKNFTDALKTANQLAADRVARGMRASLKEQIGNRDQRPGQRLERALTDDQNKVVYANAFQVGIEAWLNKSPAALYWRSIEEGMAGYDAYVLFANGTPFGKPVRPWFSPGAEVGQMRMAQFSRRGGKVHGVQVHVRAFAGYEYSEGGKQAFNRLSMFDLYRTELRRAGIEITPEMLRRPK